MTSQTKQGFQKGTGCFKCQDCGKLTRLNTYDSENGSCSDCNEAFEIENAIQDGAIMTEKEMTFFKKQEEKWKQYFKETEGGNN